MKSYTRTTLFLTLLSIVLGSSQPVMAMNAPAANNADNLPAQNNYPPVAPGGKIDFNNIPPMSPDELATWEAEVTKEIDQYVSTLSPEDQAQFHKEVEELTNVMSKMSPDELVKFVDQMLVEENQQAMPQPTPQPTAPTQPEVVEEKPVHTEKTPELPAKSVEAAVNLIDDLIMHIERFIRKSTMIPELPGNIEQWVSRNKIREWKNNLTWEILKTDIEALNKQLNHLKDRDPKTKNYLYLSKLIEQESLYNNLIHIRQALVRHEPKIQPPAFGLGNVTPESHEAIRQVLNTLAEAIYTLHVPTDIAKVLGTSQAREKELKEEAEKERKQAIEHSKRPQVHEGKRETVMPQQSRGGYTGGEQPGYPSYSGGYPYSGGGYYGGPETYTNKPSTPPSKPGAPGKEAPGKTEKEKKAEQENKKAAATLDETGKGLVTKIDKALEKFAEVYDTSSLQNIYNQLAGGAQIDNTLHDAITKAQTHINNALDLAKKLRTRGRTNQSSAEAIKNALRDVTAPYTERINKLINQISTLKTKRGVVVPPAVEALYTTLTDFNKEVGAKADTRGGMSAGTPVKPTKAMPEAPAPEVKGAPTPSAKAGKKESTRKAAQEKEEDQTPYGRQKAKLYGAIIDVGMALNQIKGLDEHIIKQVDKPADIATARAFTEVVDACKAVQRQAKSMTSVLHKLPAAVQKQHRTEMRKEYADDCKIFDNLVTQLTAFEQHVLKQPISLDKEYAFFGKEITEEMLGKVHQTDPAKAQAIEAIRKEFAKPTTISDLIKALQAASNAIRDI
ncbi:MAG: hypothetical protein ACHQVS_02415 [Candidatus Babeliales bacterium]